MMRVIVAAPELPAAALAELKQWLGVSIDADDEALGALLRAAVEVCADYTGIMPLAVTCEETVAAGREAEAVVLATRPVLALLEVNLIAADGARTVLDAAGYDWSIDAGGTGRLCLRGHYKPWQRLAVRFTAGLAASWASLPEAIHHGIIRLAAHQYRARDDEARSILAPASVVALWRPWRRMRLA